MSAKQFFIRSFTMKLHVFNPEHDLALAANLQNFTAPLAGRQLRVDLEFIPALWAEEGDAVLVSNEAVAQRCFREFLSSSKLFKHEPFFVTRRQVATLNLEGVEVWGWDLAIRAQLLRYGIAEHLLPTTDEIDIIRQLSHRRTATRLLAGISISGTIGQAFCCTSNDEIERKRQEFQEVVVKAPWSSSGRGVRFFRQPPSATQQGWVDNILRTQGCVMVEPLYNNKVCDFAMEFLTDGCGHTNYLGLSLFHTVNGAYTGNLVAAEDVKRQMLGDYVFVDILDKIKEILRCQTAVLFKGKYKGLFGIDMMIVGNEATGYWVHPCVELNLRRTMGMLSHQLIAQDHTAMLQLMSIQCENGQYKLRLKNIDGDHNNEEHNGHYDHYSE